MATVLIAGVAFTGLRGQPVDAAESGGLFDVPQGSGAVTLITGDKVTLTAHPGAKNGVRIEPGPGRRHIPIRTVGSGDELLVLPADAERLVGQGVLDRRLFAVKRLLADGFGDEGSKQVPLIVQQAEASRKATFGAQVSRELPALQAAAMTVAKSQAGQTWRALSAPGAVRKVWLDGKVRTALDESVPQTGAPAAWRAGYTGERVTVAVLDTGIDQTHPDLKSAVRESKDFTGTQPDAKDDVGHGTHVASTIAGSGAASSGRLRGVAPGVELLNGKVLGADGGSESQIIAGMEWAAARARVVNMSLGGEPTDGTDPMSAAVNRLTVQYGALFVIAAGNFGPAGETIGTPASADAALTVGSVTKQGAMSGFSSRGPRIGDHAAKPDVVAPGSGIVAARAKGTPAGDEDPVGDDYARMSGTSMAAPHVAGVAALLAQKYPHWKAAELKNALRSTTKPIEGTALAEQGTGLVDAERAISQQVFAESAADFGTIRWPHERPVTRTVRYRNDSATAVELTPRISGNVPAGLVELGAAKVAVPAGGAADLVVTVHPDRSTGPGYLSGWIEATDGAGNRVRTSLGLEVEPESYDLTVRAVDRNGEPVIPHFIGVSSLTGPELMIPSVPGADGNVFRVRRGQYWVSSFVPTGVGDETLVTLPKIDVSSNEVVTLDARPGLPVSMTAVDGGATSTTWRELYLVRSLQGGSVQFGTFWDDPAAKVFAVPSAAVTGQPFEFGYLEGQDAVGKTYFLAFNDQHRIPESLARKARDRQLARVEDRYVAQGHPVEARRYVTMWSSISPWGASSHTMVKAPGRRTVFFSDVPGVTWSSSIETFVDGGLESEIETHAERYLAGRTYAEEFNAAPVRTTVRAAHVDRGLLLNVLGATSTMRYPLAFDDAVPVFDQASLTLDRNHGEQTITAPRLGLLGFEVPPERSHYTLRAEATRQAAHTELATRIDCTWTFESGYDPQREDELLPLLSVRATAPVDDNSRVRAGRPHVLRGTIDGPDSPATDVRELRVRVSFDDGTTWQPLRVQRDGSDWWATVTPPAGTTFVALHAVARTGDGTAVDQTVIRSYGVRP
ncbi:S8 family serine peptidase [Kribbella sandramycini]